MRGISSLDVMEFDQYGAARAVRQGAPLLAAIARSHRVSRFGKPGGRLQKQSNPACFPDTGLLRWRSR
jgi:hypothetical protein